jgi:hypothetical protein
MDILSTANNAIRMINSYATAPDCQPFEPTPITLRLSEGVKENPLVVLGADDAEMRAIEALCVAGKVSHIYARVRDAKTGEPRRIRPGEQVSAENDATDAGVIAAIEDGAMGLWGMEGWNNIYAVEVPYGPALWAAHEIDHHYNHLAKAPPSSAFEASSLGQFLVMLLKHYDSRDVARLLGIDGLCDLKRIPITLRIEGAADHNLGACLRGDVPGIDPQIAAAYILRTRAATYLPGASWAEVLEVFAECSKALLSAPKHTTFEWWGAGHVEVKDLTATLGDHEYDRPAFNGEAYPLRLRLLPVVAAYWRKTYAARIKTAHGWGLRMGGGGENIADAITLLRSEVFQRELGLKVGAPAPQNVYCFPERGIGGGTFNE